MKKLCALCAVVLFAAAAFHNPATHVSAKNDKFKRSSRPVPNRYIVVLDPNQDFRFDPDATIDDLNKQFPGAIGHQYSATLTGYSVEMPPGLAMQLSDDPRVKYVEEDGYVTESDVEYNPGWGLDRIDQRSLPFDFTFNYSGSGSGVNVYILDSGILTTHAELQGRAFNAYDAVHDNTPVNQCNGHGTGVAGVVGGATFGVAKQASLYSVRILPCTGFGTVSDLVSGIDWVTRHAVRPAVANLSVETTLSPTVNDAVSASISAGITYVVAAGNDSGDACVTSPSAVPGTISVGATNNMDSRVSWSNFGSCVDLFAPGEGVSTIWNSTDTTTTYASGTSFSSPFVAGAAALYLGQHPNATPAEVSGAITSAATTNIVGDPGANSPNRLLYLSFNATPPPSSCDGAAYNGSLTSPGTLDYQTNISGFAGSGGKYLANLQIPVGASFTLSLEKKGGTKWSTVAASPTGSIVYNGKSGTYRWKVADVAGSGIYSLCTVTP
jgi:subtilisin family serine protease